jgi:hypothetical protein
VTVDDGSSSPLLDVRFTQPKPANIFGIARGAADPPLTSRLRVLV